MGMLTNVWNLQKKQDLQVETRCDWLCPLKDGWEVGYQWRTECFFYKSKGSWDSGPYPNWKVPYISWCFWHHGWLTEGGENLQVPTLLLACLRTVPVAAVSLTCLLYSRSWNEASCTWASLPKAKPLPWRENVVYTIMLLQHALKGRRVFVNVLIILRWISSYHKHWGVNDVIFKVSHIFTFYLTGTSNRNAISESSQVLQLLSYVNEVSYTHY